MEAKHIDLVSLELGIAHNSVKNTLELLHTGATIPFIARYRKEKTNSLDEVQVADIKKIYGKILELEARKDYIIATIAEQGKLTPELKSKIESCYDAITLEDFYAPYKQKKKTKADVARMEGLEPLAKLIMTQRGQRISDKAKSYLNANIKSVGEAIEGASHIISEWISEDQNIKEKIRNTYRKSGIMATKVIPKKKTEALKYEDYFDFSEMIKKCPSHRFLAMMRGKEEGFLKVSLSIDDELVLDMIDRRFITSNGEEAEIISVAVLDAYKRLIQPSVETQIISEAKERADDEAISVFVKNLRQLLLAAPLSQQPIIAVDPGFRTGCKIVALDKYGDFLAYETIFPHQPQMQLSQASETILHLTEKYRVTAVAIGNGTASRETLTFLEGIDFKARVGHAVELFVISESGASIYSASEVARKELGDHDLTVRGAISIGRRLLDPLAELVKVDAKSIGVGQYQHDVNQPKLKESLDMTVSSCVNLVGVNLNTASYHLLTHISGLGTGLAQNIVKFRAENGDFVDLKQLSKVPRLGAKAFEQAAGFLRIRNGTNLLDNTGVHPESYPLVLKMSKDHKVSVQEFIAHPALRKSVNLAQYASESVGMPTLIDIMRELDKPGLDPRGEAKAFRFDDSIRSIDDVCEGMILPGIVTNLTNFGAFVDIGLKQDGMLHISQIATKFIKSPSDVLALQDKLSVKVIGIDKDKKRINLSLLF